MWKAPPIVTYMPGGGPPAKLIECIPAFHTDCVVRRLERMDITTKEKIEVVDGIIRALKAEERSPSSVGTKRPQLAETRAVYHHSNRPIWQLGRNTFIL